MIATRNGFEVLRFPVMQSSFSFTYAGKKRLHTMCALENNSKVKAAVEFIDANLHLFGEDSAL